MFFLRERQQLAALELRRSSLQLLGSSTSSLGAVLMHGQEPVASTCVQRTLDSALAASRRRVHQTALGELKAKFELPLAYRGYALNLFGSVVECYVITHTLCFAVADVERPSRDLRSTICQW